MAADEAGDAVIVWATDTVVQAAYRPAGGTWSVAPVGAGAAPQAALDAAGNVVALWLDARRLRSAVGPGPVPLIGSDRLPSGIRSIQHELTEQAGS